MKSHAASSIIFRVLADGKVVFDSGTMKGTTPAKLVKVDVSGVKELRLLAEDVLHYMRQYYPVMGVRSDFVKRDRERLASGEQERLTDYSLD